MTALSTINIGLCGLGTVGQGVWQHIQANLPTLEARLGVRLRFVSVSMRDLSKPRDVQVPAEIITADPMAVATNPSVHIVCELIGGTTVAREVTLAALRLGKTVVTANKALLCDHGEEIFATARAHKAGLFFEASVAGGIPIIKALREGLVANRFPAIEGILNGTCNYMLTRMEREGLAYPEILADAKRLGYAEADESLDVEGWDTAHKAAVLAYLAHGVWVPTSSMLVQGITRISPEDIRRASDLGYAIKLIANITRDFSAKTLSVRIYPALLARSCILANVHEVFNAVSVTGDIVGTTTYIGRGAGRDATASAVISDIVDAATYLRNGVSLMPPAPPPASDLPTLADLGTIRSAFYLRLSVKDQPGVLASVAGRLSAHGISIASMLQKPDPGKQDQANLFLTTHEASEKSLAAALSEISSLPTTTGEPMFLRIA